MGQDAMADVEEVIRLLDSAKDAVEQGRHKLAAAALDEASKEARDAAKAIRARGKAAK